jgi:hypothetical protein
MITLLNYKSYNYEKLLSSYSIFSYTFLYFFL